MIESSPSKRFQAESFTVMLLRGLVGLIFVLHGWGKVIDVAGTAQNFQNLGIPEPQIMVYVAIAGEFFAGLGLLVGLFTRVAALGTLCTMLVAIITVHFGKGFWNHNGGYEYPLVLGLVSMFFVAYGAGPYSLDAMLKQAQVPGFRNQRITSHA
jgi:putative oxidoreductase